MRFSKWLILALLVLAMVVGYVACFDYGSFNPRVIALRSELMRYDSLAAAGKLDPNAVPTAIRALDSDDEFCRQLAVTVLVRAGQAARPAVPRLLTIVKGHKDNNLRRGATLLLGSLNEGQAFDLMLDVISDHHDDPAVRGSAAHVLVTLDPARALGTLLAILRDNSDNAALRGQVATALGDSGLKEAIRALAEAMNDGEEYVRSSAKLALAKAKKEGRK